MHCFHTRTHTPSMHTLNATTHLVHARLDDTPSQPLQLLTRLHAHTHASSARNLRRPHTTRNNMEPALVNDYARGLLSCAASPSQLISRHCR
jgi:hypothetical protein